MHPINDVTLEPEWNAARRKWFAIHVVYNFMLITKKNLQRCAIFNRFEYLFKDIWKWESHYTVILFILLVRCKVCFF